MESHKIPWFQTTKQCFNLNHSPHPNMGSSSGKSWTGSPQTGQVLLKVPSKSDITTGNTPSIWNAVWYTNMAMGNDQFE
jgi:hypothetical protein